MTCKTFDQAWNELLDAETVGARGAPNDALAGGTPSDREQAAREHAASCPACRQRQARYELLRQALRSWSLAPRPASSAPADLVERILAAVPASFDSSTLPFGQTKPATKHWRIGLPLGAATAAAAAVLILFVVPLTWERKRLDVGQTPGGAMRQHQPWSVSGPAPSLARHHRGRPGLSASLAGATAATWDLAVTASEPAARLGRGVLGAATAARIESSGRSRSEPPGAGPGESIAAGLPSIPALFQSLPDSPPGSALLQEVGDSLSATVRPLSSTARQAFGFLRAPSLGKNDNRINPPVSKGA